MTSHQTTALLEQDGPAGSGRSLFSSRSGVTIQSRRDDHIAFKAIMLRSSPSVSLAWLTDMLERTISGRTKANELERLLPWNWKMARPIDT
jgi:hypothetical protein